MTLPLHLQQKITGRICATEGCDVCIDNLCKASKYCRPCSSKRDLERRIASIKLRRSTPEGRAAENAKRKARVAAVRPWDRAVYSYNDPVKNHRQKFCTVCYGMPWARVQDRFRDEREFAGSEIVNDNGLCKGCGEPWGPEPFERPSLLTSSAGTAVREGKLYGMQFQEGKGLPEKSGAK